MAGRRLWRPATVGTSFVRFYQLPGRASQMLLGLRMWMVLFKRLTITKKTPATERSSSYSWGLGRWYVLFYTHAAGQSREFFYSCTDSIRSKGRSYAQL